MKTFLSSKSEPILLIGALILVTPATLAQVGAALGVLTTGVVLDQASKKAQEVIDAGTRSGDYLLTRAGIESRIAIENAKLASSDVLEVAVKDIGKERFDLISGINQTLDDALRGAISSTEAVNRAQEGIHQVGNILDGQGHRSYMIRYSPLVIISNSKQNKNFQLSVRGVNLDESKATLEFYGHALKPLTVGKQDLIFEIPSSMINFSLDSSSIIKGKLRYESIKPGWLNRLSGKKENVERDIVLLAQPVNMASFEYAPTVGFKEIKRISKSYPLPQFKGYDSDMETAIQAPPGQDIDLATLRYAPISGEGNSYCIGFVPAQQTKFGVTFQAHVGRINANFSKRPGYINCQVMYDLTEESKASRAGKVVKGTVGWFDDVPIVFEDGVESYALNIKTYDGRTRTFSSSGSDKFYRVSKEPTRIVITPKPPTDLMSQ